MALYDYPLAPNQEAPTTGSLPALRASDEVTGSVATQGANAERVIMGLRVTDEVSWPGAESQINGLKATAPEIRKVGG